MSYYKVELLINFTENGSFSRKFPVWCKLLLETGSNPFASSTSVMYQDRIYWVHMYFPCQTASENAITNKSIIYPALYGNTVMPLLSEAHSNSCE